MDMCRSLKITLAPFDLSGRPEWAVGQVVGCPIQAIV